MKGLGWWCRVKGTTFDIASCRVYRSYIFFINEVFCFLKINDSEMEKDGEKVIGDATSRMRSELWSLISQMIKVGKIHTESLYL